MADNTAPVQHCKITEFKSWDYANPHYLFCENHTGLRWLYKGPGRNLHFLWTRAESNDYRECECPYSDLMVILHPEDAEYENDAEREDRIERERFAMPFDEHEQEKFEAKEAENVWLGVGHDPNGEQW